MDSSQQNEPEWGHIDKRPEECPEAMKHNWIEIPNPLGKGQILNISLELDEDTPKRTVIRLMHKWNEKTWERYGKKEEMGDYLINSS